MSDQDQYRSFGNQSESTGSDSESCDDSVVSLGRSLYSSSSYPGIFYRYQQSVYGGPKSKKTDFFALEGSEGNYENSMMNNEFSSIEPAQEIFEEYHTRPKLFTKQNISVAILTFQLIVTFIFGAFLIEYSLDKSASWKAYTIALIIGTCLVWVASFFNAQVLIWKEFNRFNYVYWNIIFTGLYSIGFCTSSLYTFSNTSNPNPTPIQILVSIISISTLLQTLLQNEQLRDSNRRNLLLFRQQLLV